MSKPQSLFGRKSSAPEPSALAEQKHLLHSWRTMLRVCLELNHALDPALIPTEVANSIVEARGEITRIKAMLREQGEEVADLADEVPVADASEVKHQLNLLAIHRRSLEQLLRQQEHFGERDTPPAVTNGILNARTEIAQIKRRLTEWQAPVSDLPSD